MSFSTIALQQLLWVAAVVILAYQKRRNMLVWGLASAALGPFALLALLVSTRVPAARADASRRRSSAVLGIGLGVAWTFICACVYAVSAKEQQPGAIMAGAVGVLLVIVGLVTLAAVAHDEDRAQEAEERVGGVRAGGQSRIA